MLGISVIRTAVRMPCVKNILFIMADQLRWDYLSCTGHPTLDTPNIDRLAKKGVLFPRGYVQSPVCGPSRMSFYTGRYVCSHRSTWLFVPLPLSELCIGDYMGQAGLGMSLIGKSHFFPDLNSINRLGGAADERRAALALEGGFEVIMRDDGVFGNGPVDTPYANYLRSLGYNSDNPWHDYANSAKGSKDQVLSGWQMRYAKEPARIPDEHGETAYTTDCAIDFIASKAEEPWSLHLSYIKPHWPYVVSAPYNDMYGSDDVVAAQRSTSELENCNPVVKAFIDREDSREFMRDDVRETVIPIYMGLISQLDHHIGRLLDYLEAAGRMEDTMIVFTSDHGDYLGDHWLGEKELFHDPSVRVPVIIYDPRHAADPTRGKVDNRLVEGIDIIPTFLEALGQDIPPEALEGRSLIPLLHDDAGPWREAVFSELDYAFHKDVRDYLGISEQECRAMMVFDGRWKYIFYEGFTPQLFDLESDPQELIDLGGDPGYKQERVRLHEMLFAWIRTRKLRTTVDNGFVDSWQEDAYRRGITVGRW
ncbi:MAG: sulfatase-like hydrolase/transferase [Pseudomonadota bacterium]